MSILPLALLLLAQGAQAAAPDQVTMTLEEFLKLYEGTKNRPPVPEKSPRAYALSSARYDGRVVFDDGEPTSAAFKATFTVEVLKEGWVRIPLLNAAVGVQKATIAGADAPIVLENGSYTLVTDRRGRFQVDVEFAVAVQTDRGSSGFTFPLEPSGATAMSLAVPVAENLDFTVVNSKLKQDRVVGGARVVEATLPATGSLAVSWQRALDQSVAGEPEKKLDPRIYSEVHTLVAVGEGLMSATTVLNQNILFAGVERIQARIPQGMRVLDVRGNGVQDWSVDDAGLLTALLNYEAKGTYQLTIDMERVVEGSSVVAPIVEPVGVERSKGFVAIQARGALEVQSGAVTGASVVDVRTLPADILGVTGLPVLLGFKYLGGDVSIPLSVLEHEEVDVLVTLLDQAQATTAFTIDGRRLTSVRYQVRNNRRQFLRLALPVGATLWSASVAERAVQPAQSEGRLLIPLVRSQASGGALAAFEVEVVYVESGTGPTPGGRGTFEGSLPVADAPTTYVAWSVYVPDQAKVKRRSFEGSLRETSNLSRPLSTPTVMQMDDYSQQMNQNALGQQAMGGMGNGAAPVKVHLPLDGQALHFEKLLALDERLWVGFDYKGLK